MLGYNLFRQDRNRRGGGVAIYSHGDLAVTSVDAAALSNIPIEHCCVRVSASSDLPFILCCVYRPPSTKLASWQAGFYTLLDILTTDKLPVIIVGDLNVNLMADSTFADNLKSDYHLI
jgi:exonuclease III